MNRRVFLTVLSSTATAALCGASYANADDGASAFDEVDAGPLDAFAQDVVYDQYREQGFFIIRRAEEVFALSSICTHKGCKVRAQTDQSYLCKCHQSRFDPAGKVLNGPATVDLPRLKVKLSADKSVLVRVPRKR